MIAPVMGEASFVGAGSAAEEALGTSAGTGAHASARGQGALKAASGSATPGSVSGKSAGNAAQLQKSWQSELAEQTNRLTGKSYSASGAGSGLGSGLDPDSGLSELNLEDSDLDMGSNLDSGNEGAAGSAGKSSLATSAAMTLASTTGQRGARQILSQSAGDGSGALTSKQLSSRMASLRNQSVNQSANQSVSVAGTLNARQSLTVADRSTASGATIAEHRNSAELHLSVSDAASIGQSANLPAHLQEAVATAAGLASAVPQSSSMLSESAPATAHSPSDSVASGVTRRVSAGIESSGLRAVTSAGSAASGNAASGRVSDTVLSSSSAISVGIPASSTLNGSGAGLRLWRGVEAASYRQSTRSSQGYRRPQRNRPSAQRPWGRKLQPFRWQRVRPWRAPAGFSRRRRQGCLMGHRESTREPRLPRNRLHSYPPPERTVRVLRSRRRGPVLQFCNRGRRPCPSRQASSTLCAPL